MPSPTETFLSHSSPRIPSRGDWCCFAIAGLIASCVLGFYYVAGWYRGEDTSLLILYRPTLGDRDYFPLARQFAEGQFGDGYTSGLVGQGWVGFPIASVIVHGLGLRWLGPVGFAIADILTPCLYLLVATRLLWRAGATWRVALIVALFFTLEGAATAAHAIFATFGHALHGFPFYLEFLQSWELRFPRNFVSEIFLLGALGNWCELARTGFPRRFGWWIGTAAWMGALLQSDIYSFIALALAFSAIALAWWIRLRVLPPRAFVARLGLLIGVGLVLALPFLVQHSGLNPEVSDRYGVFTLSRRQAFDLAAVAWSFFPRTFVYLTLAWPWVAWAWLRRLHRPDLCPASQALALTCLQLAGYAAMPFLVGATGQAVQLYHFRDAARTLLAWSAIIAFSLLLTVAAMTLRRFFVASRPGRMGLAATASVVLMLLLWSVQLRAQEHLANPGQPRNITRPIPAAVRNYHADLAALIPELDRAAATGRSVLATADVELYAWWTGLRGRQSFLAHSFVSALGYDTLFERLALFAYYNQVTTADFVPWLVAEGIDGVHGCWFSGDRYQASSLHAFAPVAAYSAPEQKDIAATPPLDCWRLIIPSAERQRLTEAYARVIASPAAATTPAPDLIVLTNEFPVLRPDPNRFQLLHENATFRVFGARR